MSEMERERARFFDRFECMCMCVCMILCAFDHIMLLII